MVTSERPWARHYHETWQERAGDDRLPYWLRVAALAYGNHTDNGHARFKRGEVAMVLGRLDTDTGQLVPFDNVGRAIEAAVEYGWLMPESFWGCLVVPAHAIKKGEHGRKPSARSMPTGAVKVAKRSLSDGFVLSRLHPVSVSSRESLTQ